VALPWTNYCRLCECQQVQKLLGDCFHDWVSSQRVKRDLEIDLHEHLSRHHVVDVSSGGTNCRLRPSSYPKTELTWRQKSCTGVLHTAASNIGSESLPTSIWRTSPVFLLIGVRPSCYWLTRSVMAISNGWSSGAPSNRSLRCCGLKPSRPPAEPLIHELMAFLVTTGNTWSGGTTVDGAGRRSRKSIWL